MIVFGLFFLVPVLDVVKDLLFVDVRHAVVLSQLVGVERLSTAGFPGDCDLERLEAALLAEFLFDALDVGSQATLAVPLEAALIAGTFLSLTVLSCTLLVRDENLGWLRFYVQHYELLPVEV